MHRMLEPNPHPHPHPTLQHSNSGGSSNNSAGGTSKLAAELGLPPHHERKRTDSGPRILLVDDGPMPLPAATTPTAAASASSSSPSSSSTSPASPSYSESVLFTLLSLTDDVVRRHSHSPHPDHIRVLRGAVFFIGMACWGSQRVAALGRVPFRRTVRHLQTVMACANKGRAVRFILYLSM